MVENGDPNLTVLGKLRTKKREKELRREREDEGERIEESSEKMRRSAPGNRGRERDRTLEERVADGVTAARQLETQALLSFRCTHLR